MRKQLNFTKHALDNLGPPPEGKRAYYYDTKVNGLLVAVTSKGTKTFAVYRRIKGRPYPSRIPLGRFPDMKPAQARDEAKIMIGQIAAGHDPAANRKREKAESVTLKLAFEEFLRVRSHRTKTVYDYQNIINRAFGDWQNKRLLRISKDMVAKQHQKLGKESGEAYANLAMRVFRAVYNFAAAHYEDAEGSSLLPPNPVKRLSDTRAWYRQTPRNSRIEPNELPAWFEAVLALKAGTSNPIAKTTADFLLLLILTGLRRQEAATLTWEDINLENRTLTIQDTKNHEPHTLPLSDHLHGLLSERREASESDYVFPGKTADAPLIEPRNYIDKVKKAAEIHFTPHDLRRTFITVAESLDISAYAVKRLVNHKMRNDVTAGYIVTDIERLRKPMQTITDYFLKAGMIKTTPVILITSNKRTEAR